MSEPTLTESQENSSGYVLAITGLALVLGLVEGVPIIYRCMMGIL